MEKIKLIDAETLFYKSLDQPRMLIEGILPEGLAIMSGDSKIGKSWMVLWLCLKISRGEPVWGLPTYKSDVVYLALEDREWRLQQRMQELSDDPPENLHFGFSCGKIGQELEGQIESILQDLPKTKLIFIDTLQMVRDNVSGRVNGYAKDYEDLTALKRIADNHRICIFLIHHNRKEKDGSNVFNDMTGSTGISGVVDTCMILQRQDRFSNNAVLSITGRDIEERQLKMMLTKNVWEVTEELDTTELRKQKIPPFIYGVADYLLEKGHFVGTATDLLAVAGETELKPNRASALLSKHYENVLRPMGVILEFQKTTDARLIIMHMGSDDQDDEDDVYGSGRAASYQKRNDDTGSLLIASSQPSLSSFPEITADDDLF